MKNFLLNFFIISAFFIFFFVILKDNFSASFWIIDDHEIVANVYQIKKNGVFNNFINLIKGDLEWGRFRPSYWFTRNLEFFLFNLNVNYYYYFHFLTIFLGFVLLFLAFKFFYHQNLILALLSTLLIAFNSLWIDIYPRLAPSERYAFLYFSIYLYFFSLLLKVKQPGVGKLIIFLFSGIFLSLAKENFIIFLPITFLIIIFYLLKNNYGKIEKLIFFILIAFISFIVLYFSFLIKSKGVDVYGRPVSFLYRILVLKSNLQDFFIKSGFLEILTLLSVAAILRFNHFLFILILFLIFLLIGFFNYFINLGQFLAPRYLFPVVVLKYYFIPLFFFFIVFFIENIKRLKSVIFNLSLVIFLYLIINLYFDYHNLNSFKAVVRNNYERTNKFKEYLNHIEKEVRGESKKVIVFNFNYGYYEQIFSINRFLSARNINNRRYLLFEDNCQLKENYSLEKKLCLNINDLAKNKRKKIDDLFYLQVINKNQLLEIKDCLIISNESIPDSKCKLIDPF